MSLSRERDVEAPSLPDTVGAAVESGRLMAHVQEFARRIKLSGTPEELESFHYLEARMRDYGYRTRLLSHDAYISLPGAARLMVGGQEFRCITHALSAGGNAEATLVDSGAGGAAGFAGADLRGRIALLDGIATPEAATLAMQAGALGLVHISPTEHLYEMCVSPVWGSPSQHTRSQLPTTVMCTVANADGAALRERLRGGETLSVRIETEVRTGWCKTPLLVAELDASDGADPFILLSGHHDTWHYGVMDNGGANATMLEAARVLAAQRGAWRRGLRVCFWSGHSHGRYSGSAWYVDEHWDELDRRCAAHVNVDSTGAVGATVLTETGVADELAGLAKAEIAAVTGQTHAGRRQARAADASFWGVGIPSMFGSLSHQPPDPEKRFRNALGWWWHTPHDLLDKIDPTHLVRDTQIIARVVARLLTDPVLPLDVAASAQALHATLTEIDRGLAGRLDLAPALAAAAALAERSASGGGDHALMQACRALVPLNYTNGDRFVHDPALPQAPWPALDGLRALAALPADAADTLFYTVHARRTRNRVAHALRSAIAAFDTGATP